MASQEPLPQEIWWMICQELTAAREFDSLFSLALVSQSLASIALPLLYSIHEQVSASADDASVDGKAKLATLWRAIILSSVGKTFYPYCLWIKNLRLGNLMELLDDIAPYHNRREAFFSDDMEQFHLQDSTKLTRQNKPRLDKQPISTKVGETITTFVKDAAERENKIVALTGLEGNYIPMDKLPVWTSRLSTLTSLAIQDGSVIGPQVAAAIRDHCPNFNELECYYCDGSTVDEDMAGFFNTLPANTLQSFSVISKNRLGELAFEALGHHSSSLKALRLSTLQPQAFGYLNALSQCTALESLTLEAELGVRFDWESEYKDSFLEVISWLKDCSSLTNLEMTMVPNAAKILGQVLKSPKIRLKSMYVGLDDTDESFYTSLGSQTSLRTLSVQSSDELLNLATTQHAQFLRSICKCHELRKLNLMMTMLTLDDLNDLSRSLTFLEEVSFDGEELSDDIFQPMAELPYLRILYITAVTTFTFDGILNFINQMAMKSRAVAEDVGLSIMNQSGELKFSEDEVEILTQRMLAAVRGRLEILYNRDPDEEHESDFSD